jgi:hypothetical protein
MSHRQTIERVNLVAGEGVRCAGPSPVLLERRPFEPMPKPVSPSEDESGPKRPDTDSPDKDNLLKRMKKVDPKQAERYRQRTGQ